MAGFADLMHLLETDIPECRLRLKDSHTNLEKVASYCEGNYLQAQDKHRALEETKNYTTQSLASVAYQINMLATNFLHLLDLQTVQIGEMESSINHLSQIVMIHKEKVARREIGELTTNKAVTRLPGVKNPGIIFPEKQEMPVKYVRKPIDYTVLDSIGHGVKQQQQQQQGAQMRTSSVSSGSSSGTMRGAPTTHPPTPPTSMYGSAASGTLRMSNSPYRTPAPPVNPPSVPSNYAGSTHPLAGVGAMGPVRGEAGYAPGGVAMISTPQSAVPMRMVQPLQQQSSMYGAASPLPPPMQDISQRPYISDPILLSDTTMYRQSQQMGNVSPPLPPPPSGDVDDNRFTLLAPFEARYNSANMDSIDYGGNYGGDYSSRRSRLEDEQEEWIPENYLEKVVAIYSYQRDKEDELTFEEGAVIYVIKKNDDGWWEGVMDGHTGLFPGNYVEPCI